MVKTRISNSWNWIEIQGMTNQKYDVFDKPLGRRDREVEIQLTDSGQFCT